MKFAPMINPEARKGVPKPLRVDLRKAFAIGTILWTVLSVILVFLALFHILSWHFVRISVAGIIIGILMLIWEHFDRWDYRRLGK